jgi:hypothetical protein
VVTLSTRLAPAPFSALRSVAGRPWWPSWRRTPFTCVYLALLAVTTVLLSLLNSGDHDAVLQLSSTDVRHLAVHPVFALISSALWVDGIVDYLIAAVILGALSTILELRIGTRWVIAIFASGHVIATLATEGAVAVGVHAGWLPTNALSRLDVGISYGLAAILAAAAGLLPGRAKALGVLAAWAYLGWPLVAAQDMTSWGHVIALGIGVCWWPWLKRRGVVTRTLPTIGMMERWSMSRWPAPSSSPRPHSTIRTSPARSSCCSTTTAKVHSASSSTGLVTSLPATRCRGGPTPRARRRSSTSAAR